MSGIIDCQSHLYAPAVLERLERRAADPRVKRRGGERWVEMGAWHRRVFPHHADIDAKVAMMDANGIALTALSINDPGPEWFGADAPAVARACNEFIADAGRRHPGRFIGLAVLPLPDVGAALAELERCVHELGLRGVLLYTNFAGRFPDEPAFRPVFARAAALGLPMLLHPAKPVTLEAVKDYELTGTLGNMFEDTIALSRLIMSGLLDELPDLNLVCPHLGGALPYLIGRLDHQTQVLRRGPTLRRKPSEYLRRVWFDIVSPLPEAIRFACDLLGTERLLFASDHPWVEPAVILDALRGAGLPPAVEAAILHGNARRLFRL
ncbi:MAG TPA: amidohydrolase family protein [Lacunisphaera sp.]|nr:amidohydrolase family protein [Lacunisphaera sp.]